MSAEQHSRLAAEGGRALVSAMPTPAWPVLREEAVEMVRDASPALEGALVPELDVNARMLRGAAPEHVAVMSGMLAARWSEHLARVLAASSAAEETLRRLVERIKTTASVAERPGKPTVNTVRDRSPLFAARDGNIIQHRRPKPRAAE